MRIGLIVVLSLQLLSGARASGSDAAPDVTPSTFSMAIGGFIGSSHGVVLHDGVLAYTQYSGNGGKQRKEAKPTAEQWRHFRQALDAINVWRWQAKYPNPGGVADGTQWQIDVTYPDRKLHAEGDNNYPDGNGRPTNASQQTKAFHDLRSAVQALLGDSSF